MPRLNASKKNSSSRSNLPADIPKIKMPFPPNMSAEEFLRNRPLSRAYFKPPNSFFIYRQQFVKQLKLENYNDQMIKVSKWASIFWSNEPKNVKQYYKNIEKKIQKLLKEQYDQNLNNPCQMICPKFIFENPNFENKEDDNNNTSRNINSSPFPDQTVNIDLNSSDWLPEAEYSEHSSENSPSYSPDELICNNLEELTNLFPSLDISPSPVYPSEEYNTTSIDLESCFTLFDEMSEINEINNFSFLSDDEFIPWNEPFNY